MRKLKGNKNLNGKFYTKYQLLKFENRNNMLCDEDLIDLFMGLLRLVKRNIEIKVEAKYKKTIDKLNCELNFFKKQHIKQK